MSRALVRKTDIPVVAVALPATQSEPGLFSSLAQLGLDPSQSAPVRQQFRKLSDQGGTAMIVIRDFLTAALGDDICKAGLAGHVAVIGEYGDIAKAGALLVLADQVIE